MNIFEFGDAKLRLQDIDPLYTALHNTRISKADRKRFTLAQVTFDHAGIAARVTEAPCFWTAMMDTAKETRRGAPRRYYRGEQAFSSLRTLEARYGTGEAVIDALVGPYEDVYQLICKTFPGFGPCAAFKLADMSERVCGNKIDFSQLTIKQLCSNDQVAKGFKKACDVTGIAEEDLVKRLYKHKWATLASPSYNRPLNVQEFETIICYYSHDDKHNKHMPGMDSPGIESELRGYGKLADRLIKALPHTLRAQQGAKNASR